MTPEQKAALKVLLRGGLLYGLKKVTQPFMHSMFQAFEPAMEQIGNEYIDQIPAEIAVQLNKAFPPVQK